MFNEERKGKLSGLVNGDVLFDEALAGHSTIKVGGLAGAFVTPADAGKLIDVLKFAREENIDTFVVGAGSNVLFRDGGFDGIIVSTAKLNTFEVKNTDGAASRVDAGSGVLISELVGLSLREGLAGFESLAGIPGTVGGALSMNAGTHDGTISGPLLEVVAVGKAARIYRWPKDKIEFAYRKARFPKACIILSAEFLLMKGSKEEVGKKVGKLMERRRERHPVSWPSLGSIFKNPDKGPSAGELIEEAGLKGVRIGGARIANEHGNWIINEGGASSKDVEVLIHLAREKVKEVSNVSLETEIVIVGRR